MTQNADYAVFDLADTLLLIWKQSMTIEGVEEMEETLKRMVARSRDKLMFLTIIDGGVDMKAPPEARKALSAAIKKHANQIAAAAIVLEASGFQATAIRSVVTAVSLATRTPFKEKVFSDVSSAIRWLVETAGHAPRKVEQLSRQVEGKRSLASSVA